MRAADRLGAGQIGDRPACPQHTRVAPGGQPQRRRGFDEQRASGVVRRGEAIEQIAVAAMTRRADLERVKSTAAGAVAVEANTLLTRMKKFLRFT